MPQDVEWTRSTPWRQGHVLTSEAATHFGLAHHSHPDDTVVLVISHDCDVANANMDAEPDIEVIVGRTVANAEGNFTWGKTPKTLHLEVARDGVVTVVELQSRRKHVLPKTQLATFTPNVAYTLSPVGRSALRSWLGSRYNRAAFPDTFNRRLEATKFDKRLAKVLSGHGELISFVYFELSGAEQQELPDGTPYELTIVVVYPPGSAPDESADAADKVVEEIEKAAAERLFDKDKKPSDLVRLKSCFALSEQDITVSQARLLMHWRLEHMTLKADDVEPGPMNF